MLAAHTKDWEQFAGIMSGLLSTKRAARVTKIGEKA